MTHTELVRLVAELILSAAVAAPEVSDEAH